MLRKMGKERVRCFVPEGSQKRKATRVRSLRQRWIVNSVVPIFVLLALIVVGYFGASTLFLQRRVLRPIHPGGVEET